MDNQEIVSDIVNMEYQALLQRCAEQGVAADDVKATLYRQFVFESLKRMSDETVSSRKMELLEKVHTLYKAGDVDKYRIACVEWLAAAKNVKIGQVAIVRGWTTPREILVESVRLEWHSGHRPEDACVVLSGPTRCPGVKMDIRDNVVLLDTVMTVCRPSATFQNRFAERLSAAVCPAKII